MTLMSTGRLFIFSLSNMQQSSRTTKITPHKKLNDKVATWFQKSKTVLSSRNHDDNTRDDGISAQSTYSINISDSNYIASLTPNEDILKKTIPFSLLGQDLYPVFDGGE